MKVAALFFAFVALPALMVARPVLAGDSTTTRPDSIRVSILQPDGKPAADAKVIVGHELAVATITFSKDITVEPFLGTTPLQCTSSVDGIVWIPPQVDWYTIAVLHDSGYAEVYLNGGDKAREIQVQIQPYGKVQGRLMLGGQPGAGKKVYLVQGDWTRPILGIIHQVEAVCDADGKFVIPRVPPRKFVVTRELPRGSWRSWHIGNGKPVDIAAGQTLDIQLGGSGRPVIVRADLPDEISQRKDLRWDKISATAEEPNTGWQSYDADLQPDGSFKFEDVVPGKYKLDLEVDQTYMRVEGDTALGPLAKATAEFTVAPNSNAPLDLGPVKLEMANFITVGNPAPDFTAKTLDGKDIKLSDFRGKFVLLDFWATWCQPCVEETPDIKDAYDTFGKDDRFAMIGVNLDDKRLDAQTYVKENAMAWPQIPEVENNDQPIVRQYGVESIPSIWLIGPDGKVIAKNIRGDAVKSAVAKALAK